MKIRSHDVITRGRSRCRPSERPAKRRARCHSADFSNAYLLIYRLLESEPALQFWLLFVWSFVRLLLGRMLHQNDFKAHQSMFTRFGKPLVGSCGAMDETNDSGQQGTSDNKVKT